MSVFTVNGINHIATFDHITVVYAHLNSWMRDFISNFTLVDAIPIHSDFKVDSVFLNRQFLIMAFGVFFLYCTVLSLCISCSFNSQTLLKTDTIKSIQNHYHCLRFGCCWITKRKLKSYSNEWFAKNEVKMWPLCLKRVVFLISRMPKEKELVHTVRLSEWWVLLFVGVGIYCNNLKFQTTIIKFDGPIYQLIVDLKETKMRFYAALSNV